jgi:hypothetical protein
MLKVYGLVGSSKVQKVGHGHDISGVFATIKRPMLKLQLLLVWCCSLCKLNISGCGRRYAKAVDCRCGQGCRH